MMSQHLIPPRWLQESSERLNQAIVIVNSTADSLKVYESYEQAGIYSKEVFSARLVDEKDDYSAKLKVANDFLVKLLKENDDLFNAKKKELDQAFNDIVLQRKKLIDDLVAWQKEKPKQVERDINELTATLKASSLTLEKRAEICKKFAVDPKDVDADKMKLILLQNFVYENEGYAEVVLDEKGNFKAINRLSHPACLIGSVDSLLKKSNKELLILAKNTKFQNLATAANTLVEANAKYDAMYKQFYGLEVVDNYHQSEINKITEELIPEVKKIIKKRIEVAKQLESECQDNYAKLRQEKDEFLAQIELLDTALNEANKKMASTAKQITDDDLYRELNSRAPFDAKLERVMGLHREAMIKAYQESEVAYLEAKPISDKASETFDVIMKKYRDIDKKYGYPRRESLDKLEAQTGKAISALVSNLIEAHANASLYKNDIKTQKRFVAEEQIYLLIKAEIDKHEFWSHQVSRIFGSCSKIGNTEVPTGIYEMNDVINKNDLYRTYSQKLQGFRSIAIDRVNAGTGFFARRTDSTTGRFYSLLSTLRLGPNTSEAELIRVRAMLNEMHGVKAPVPPQSRSAPVHVAPGRNLKG